MGQGEAEIDRLIARRQLERIPPDRAHADLLLHQARAHVVAAQSIVEVDPVGAFQLLYDAARKSLVAVLEVRGLRATSRGGHVTVAEATLAQLDPPHGDVLRPFDRMRRRRNEAEYPRPDTPGFTSADVAQDLPKVQHILDLAARLLAQVS